MAKQLANKPLEFCGRICECKPLVNKEDLQSHLVEQSKTRLVVAGLPRTATNEDLRVAFEALAAVAYAYVIKDGSERELNKGFGHVIFACQEELQKILQLKQTVCVLETPVNYFKQPIGEIKTNFRPRHLGKPAAGCSIGTVDRIVQLGRQGVDQSPASKVTKASPEASVIGDTGSPNQQVEHSLTATAIQRDGRQIVKLPLNLGNAKDAEARSSSGPAGAQLSDPIAPLHDEQLVAEIRRARATTAEGREDSSFLKNRRMTAILGMSRHLSKKPESGYRFNQRKALPQRAEDADRSPGSGSGKQKPSDLIGSNSSLL